MNNSITVMVIVEGKTEIKFVNRVLKHYLAAKNIFITPTQISKPGQKGGDVKFARAEQDIRLHLKQRSDTYVTIFFDYYGIKQGWPGLTEANQRTEPDQIAACINRATSERVNEAYDSFGSTWRFIPNIVVHEFEGLLFSDPEKLATMLSVSETAVQDILNECGEPEKINNTRETAPKKRIKNLNNRFKETSIGIDIAHAIGIDKMRAQCPVFNMWLTKIESKMEDQYGKA